MSAEIISTRFPEDARNVADLLRGREDTVLAACGGDGTLHAALQKLVHYPASLGVIPRGTANDLARAWNIPRNLDRAVELLIRGKPTPVDVISASRSGAYIAGAGGLGFDAGVIQRVSPWKKRWKGFSPYVPAVIFEFLRYQFPAVSINANTWEYHGPVWEVVFTKIPRYARWLKIGEKIAADSGSMDVCVVPGIPKTQILRRSVLLPIRGFKTLREASFFKAFTVKITSPSLLRYHGDGELIGDTPETFNVLPRALKVIMPPPVG